MGYLLEETYGTSIHDARMYVEKIYTYDDEQASPLLSTMNLGMDDIAFDIRCELLPEEGMNIDEFLSDGAEYDEESGWITNWLKSGILRPNPEGNDPTYVITDFGSEF